MGPKTRMKAEEKKRTNEQRDQRKKQGKKE